MSLVDAVAGAGALLLDFDGPVCKVFAGRPAPVVADELRRQVAPGEETPPEIDSPHELYIWRATRRPDLAGWLDDALTASEVAAVQLAAPTPHAHDVIRTAARAGLGVAIASNNAESAIRAYLDLHGICDVAAIRGRPYADPAGMKPNPRMVISAAEALGFRPEDCLFVGDSTTDMESSKRAGTLGIGFAKSPCRRSALAGAGAHYVVDEMGELLNAIRVPG
jgi:HAD superfamily hydrolase (TIGR01549 family)